MRVKALNEEAILACRPALGRDQSPQLKIRVRWFGVYLLRAGNPKWKFQLITLPMAKRGHKRHDENERAQPENVEAAPTNAKGTRSHRNAAESNSTDLVASSTRRLKQRPWIAAVIVVGGCGGWDCNIHRQDE